MQARAPPGFLSWTRGSLRGSMPGAMLYQFGTGATKLAGIMRPAGSALLALIIVFPAPARSRIAVARQGPADTFELAEITIAEVQAGLTSGRYTSRQLVELYLKRIEAIDRSGPSLHAVSETNPE